MNWSGEEWSVVFVSVVVCLVGWLAGWLAMAGSGWQWQWLERLERWSACSSPQSVLVFELLLLLLQGPTQPVCETALLS